MCSDLKTSHFGSVQQVRVSVRHFLQVICELLRPGNIQNTVIYGPRLCSNFLVSINNTYPVLPIALLSLKYLLALF